MKIFDRLVVCPSLLLIFIGLVSCGGLPSSNVQPSENQGGCPGSLTTIRGEAQPGAHITIHLTETGQQLGEVTVKRNGTFSIGPVTSGYDYTFAITGRRGGYEVQHYYINCGLPFFDIVFYEYTWDPPIQQDVADLITGTNPYEQCVNFHGTPRLCSSLVYDGNTDWIDGANIKDLFGTNLGPVSDAEGYSALFLERVELPDTRTADIGIMGPDLPYGNIDAFFVANTHEHLAAINEALSKVQQNPDLYKPNAFLDMVKEMSVHARHLSPDSDYPGKLTPETWKSWAGITIHGPVQSEMKDGKEFCDFLDRNCIPFVNSGVDYKDFPLFNWDEAKTSSVIAVFYEHDRDTKVDSWDAYHNIRYQDDLIDVFIINFKDPYPERSVRGSHMFRFSNRTIGPADYDKDGKLNNEDNCPYFSNPDQNDLDGDAIGDVCDDDIDGDEITNDADNCPSSFNPDQGDNEPTPPGPDGIGDECDDDDDNDAISDISDNCQYTQNADQADFDGDGIGDVCDGDVDGDAVLDTIDNCPRTPNLMQADNDSDGVGDLCDDDDDNDGVDDVPDNCVFDLNPDQLDYDKDGMGDVCDDDDDGDNVLDGDDCNPLDERIYPGATEVCDKVDNNCDGIMETGCGVSYTLKASTLEADCHAQFVCCYPNTCDPRDTDSDVEASIASGTVQARCEAKASGPGGDGYARAKVTRTFSTNVSAATLVISTDEKTAGGGCGGHNVTDVSANVIIGLYKAGVWAPDTGPTVRIQGTNTTGSMTIYRAGIPTGQVLQAGTKYIDVLMDWPVEYTAKVAGDIKGTWTYSLH